MDLLSVTDALNWILYILYFGVPIIVLSNLGILLTLININKKLGK